MLQYNYRFLKRNQNCVWSIFSKTFSEAEGNRAEKIENILGSGLGLKRKRGPKILASRHTWEIKDIFCVE